jgi:hypothetical protein
VSSSELGSSNVEFETYSISILHCSHSFDKVEQQDILLDIIGTAEGENTDVARQ